MPNVDWRFKGPSIQTCNCDWGCPCQFNARPTHGDCRAVTAVKVDEGHYGDVDLADAKWVGMFAWPKAIHEGNGEAFLIMDSGTSDAQREALFTILKGEETDPGATIFNVLAATFTEFHPPQFLPIEFDFDLERRQARVMVDGIVEASTEPIKNPVTGEEHYATVRLPHGFEYLEAEYASGNARATGPIPQDWSQAHAHMNIMELTPSGPKM